MSVRRAVLCAGLCALLAWCPAAFAADDADTPVFELGEVVVSAKGPTGVEKVTNVSEVTAQEIKAAGVTSLTGAMRLLPGVYIRTSTDGAARVDMRGMRTRQVILLLNGVPMNSTFDNQFDPGFVPVENIARIKVTKGASSVLYGSGGNAGVINIITKRGGKDAEGSVTARVGDGNERYGQATFGGSNDNVSVFASGSIYDRDGYNTSDSFDATDESLEDGGRRENSDRSRRTMFVNTVITPEEGTSIGLALNMHQGSYGKPNVADASGDFTKKAKFERMDDSEGFGAQLGVTHKFDMPLTVKGWVYANVLSELEKRYDDSDYDTQAGKKAYDAESETKRVGGAVQARYDFGAPGALTAALSAERTSWDSTLTERPDDATKKTVTEDDRAVGYWNAALEYEVSPFDRFGVVLGAGVHGQNRSDDTDSDDWSWLVGTHYDLFDTTTLRASVSRKVRFPSVKQLYDVDAGNSDLDAESTMHYEIGVDQAIAAIQTDLSVSLFRIDAEDFIEKVGTADIYENNDKYRFTGVEFAGENTTIENLRLRAAYTYLDAENRSDEAALDELQHRPEHKVTVEGWYDLPMDFSVYASWMYVGRSWAFNGDATEKTAMNTYNVVDLRVSKGFMDNTLEVFAGADNLFDEDYEEGYALPRPGRQVYTGVTWNF